jgi:hypothetical protein
MLKFDGLRRRRVAEARVRLHTADDRRRLETLSKRLERMRMLKEDQVRELADHWVKAWNSHDLDRIMSHYEDDVVLISPVAAKVLGDPSGKVAGKAALRSYFERALEVYPNLSFQLVDVMWGLRSVVLYYTNQKGSKTGEYMEIGPTGKVSRVVANYSG